jgi:hypothetical protein
MGSLTSLTTLFGLAADLLVESRAPRAVPSFRGATGIVTGTLGGCLNHSVTPVTRAACVLTRQCSTRG